MENTKIIFRSFVLADIDHLVGLMHKLGDKGLEEIKVKVLKDWDNRNSRMVGAELDGKLIGFLVGFIQPENKELDGEFVGYIESCYVEENFKNDGVAEKLLGMVLESFKRNKLSAVSMGAMAEAFIVKEMWEGQGFKSY